MKFIFKFFNTIAPSNSNLRWIISLLIKRHIFAIKPILGSFLSTYKLTGHLFPLRVRVHIGQDFLVYRHHSAKVTLNGIINVKPWSGLNSKSTLTLYQNSNLNILGDFDIGPGVHIELGKKSSLKIGGKKNASSSGITANTRIMLKKSVSIGCDSIIAWDVFISDSDWHEIAGTQMCDDVIINEKVWISHGVSILKGANIPKGCIVGAKSLVNGNRIFNEYELIAGIPAETKKTGVSWL